MKTNGADFSKRLKSAVKSARMAPGDLRWWFDRPYSTTRTWLNGREPRGPAGDESRQRLKLLEALIARGRGVPVPQTLSLYERPEYIKQLYNDHCPTIPRKRPA